MLDDLSFRSAIEFAVATEDTGTRFYSRLAQKFSDNKQISDVFTQLSRDEMVHKRQFSNLLANMPSEPGSVGSPEKTEYLKAMAISEFFSHHQGPFKGIEGIHDRDEALERAFNFEKATLGFYKAIEDVLGENPVLKEVMEAEKKHIVTLMKNVVITGAKFRSLQDEWV